MITGPGGSHHQIVSRGSGKCLDVTGSSQDNGGRIQLWSCSGGDNQGFTVESGGVTRLRAKHSGRCLDLTGKSQDSDVQIEQWDCQGGEDQRWSLKK